MDLDFLNGFESINNTQPTIQPKPQQLHKGKKVSKLPDIMVKEKKATRKSNTRFVLGIDNSIQVLHNGIYYEIHNYNEIVPNCMLYPTPYAEGSKPKRFIWDKDNIEERVKLVRKFWSRYDMRYEPIILQIDHENKKVIIKTKEHE